MKKQLEEIQKKAVEEFRKKVAEVKNDHEGKISYDFGYKYRRDDEVWTVPDWGNIEAFLTKAISDAFNKGVEEGKRKC